MSSTQESTRVEWKEQKKKKKKKSQNELVKKQ